MSAKDRIVELSLQHQVLSSQTAFLCVVKELDDVQKVEFKEKNQ